MRQVLANNNSFDKVKQVATVSWAFIGIGGAIALFFFALSLIRSVLPSFIYAVIIVYLLRPVVSFLVGRRIPRLGAVIITYLVVVGIIVILLVYFVPIIVYQFTVLINNFPRYLKALSRLVLSLEARYHRFSLPSGTDKVIAELASKIRIYGLSVVSHLPETALNVLGGIFNLILGPIIAFYLLKDLPDIKKTLLAIFPERHRQEAEVVIGKIDTALGGFLRGQALIALLVGITIGIYLWIIGVNFAFLLGALAGILNIIPYFGPIAGGAIASLVALLQSPFKALLVIIGMLVIQQIDGVVISPNILHHTVNVHPAAIILALLIGGTLFGFFGLLLAIPIAAIVKALLAYYILKPETAKPSSRS